MTEKQIVNTNTMFLLMIVAGVLIFAFMANSFMAANNNANGSPDTTTGQFVNNGNNQIQQPSSDVYIKALAGFSYDPMQVTVKKGVPVKIHFTAEQNVGCGRQLVIYGTNVNVVSKNGEEQTVEFTPQKEGTFEYSCGMRMMKPGKLVVVP